MTEHKTAGAAPTRPGLEESVTVTDQTTVLDLAEQILHVVKHYTPEIHISSDGDEPLADEQVAYCVDRFREFATQITGEIEVPSVFEYLSPHDGAEVFGDLNDADPETLAAGLAYAAAQAAALHQELARVTEQGIAFLRLLDQAGADGGEE